MLREQTEPTLEKEWREREKTSPRGWRCGGLGSEPLAEGVQPEGSHELTTAALGLWELSLGLGKTKAILMG